MANKIVHSLTFKCQQHRYIHSYSNNTNYAHHLTFDSLRLKAIRYNLQQRAMNWQRRTKRIWGNRTPRRICRYYCRLSVEIYLRLKLICFFCGKEYAKERQLYDRRWTKPSKTFSCVCVYAQQVHRYIVCHFKAFQLWDYFSSQKRHLQMQTAAYKKKFVTKSESRKNGRKSI